MTPLRTRLYALSLLLLGASAERLAETDGYVQQVETALLVIDNVRVDNASQSCTDPGYKAAVDREGYDGQYAQTILCQEAIGIEVFADLDEAEHDLTIVLDGLTATQSSSPDRGMPCENEDIDPDILANAGIDWTAISELICSTPSTSTSPVLEPMSMSNTAAFDTVSSAVTVGSSSNATQQSSHLPFSFSNTTIFTTSSSPPLTLSTSESRSVVVVTMFVTVTVTPEQQTARLTLPPVGLPAATGGAEISTDGLSTVAGRALACLCAGVVSQLD